MNGKYFFRMTLAVQYVALQAASDSSHLGPLCSITTG